MATKKVVFEIEVDADTSLEAAKTVQDWIKEYGTNWQFYVQDLKTKQVDSVDLDEHESVAVTENVQYSTYL